MATQSNNVIFSIEEISKLVESLHVLMLPTHFAQIDVLTQLLISTLSHLNDNSCIVMHSIHIISVFFPPQNQFPLVMSSGVHHASSKNRFSCLSAPFLRISLFKTHSITQTLRFWWTIPKIKNAKLETLMQREPENEKPKKQTYKYNQSKIFHLLSEAISK